jgi:hypothetical protein
MPPLSGDGQAGLKPGAASVFVLRLGSGSPGPVILEIGTGTVRPSSQADIKDHFMTDPTLQLSVEFPRSGETRTYTVGLPDGYAADRMDGYAPDCLAGNTAGFVDESISTPRDRRSGEQVLAFSLDVLAPFEFSGLAYDPLSSMAASVARLAAAEAGNDGDASDQPTGRRGSPVGCPGSPAEGPANPNDCLMALWVALESDLYRFARDRGLIAAVDVAGKEQPGEYRRFARLNDLYRDIVQVLVPYGQAPRRWTAWLRGQDYRPVLPVRLARRMERLLAGQAGQPGKALDSLARVLVKHGAIVMQSLR